MSLATSKDRLQKLQQLVTLSKQLNEKVELEAYLQLIADAAADLTNSQAGSIFLYEEETGLLKFMAAPHSHFDKLRRFRVPLQNSVAGEAFTQAAPVVILDAEHDSRVFREVDLDLPFVTRSILAVPLIYRGEALGVLEAINKRGVNVHYTEEDVTTLEILGTFAATMIFNNALIDEARFVREELAEIEKRKDEFIAVASHELRTPLGLILGHATFLRETVQLSQFVEQLDVIVQNAVRLKSILEDLFNADVARTGRARLRTNVVSLNKIIKDVARSFQRDAVQRKISLNLELPEEEILVDVDEEKISIALGNLLKNAVMYTNEGGHIFVKTELLPGYVKVAVIDDGIGIPEADLKHVFDRFYQVAAHNIRRNGGIGLGLSVAKVMVELHGGQIWAESVEGKGSNFSFLLPV